MSDTSVDPLTNHRAPFVRASTSLKPTSDAPPADVTYAVKITFSLRNPLGNTSAMRGHELFDKLTAIGTITDARDPGGRSGYLAETSRGGRGFTPMEIAAEMDRRLHAYLADQDAGYPMIHGVNVMETAVSA